MTHRKMFIFVLLIISSIPTSFGCVIAECKCDSHFGLIDCSHRGFTKIPSESFQALLGDSTYTKLNLSGNLISELNELSFVPVRFQIIDLSGNQLRLINPQTFKGLENSLQELHLGSTANDNPPNEERLAFLLRMIALKRVYLHGFLLTSLHGNYWQHLKLEELVLDGSRIASIERDAFIGLADSLQTLRIESNPLLIQLEPGLVDRLESLRHISFQRCALITLNLTFFPQQIETINLNSNQFREIGFVNELNRLQSVDLSNNQQLTFSNWVDLPSLERLNLANCGISKLPDGFLADTALKWANFEQNRLEKLPFVEKPNSKITANLLYLNLRNNSIADLGEQLRVFEAIEVIDLSENAALTRIRRGNLNLSRKNINKVQILLRNGKITGEIDQTSSDSWAELSLLDLTGNPLWCNCSTILLAQQNEIARKVLKGKCELPNYLKGREISTLFNETLQNCALDKETVSQAGDGDVMIIAVSVSASVFVLVLLLILAGFLIWRRRIRATQPTPSISSVHLKRRANPPSPTTSGNGVGAPVATISSPQQTDEPFYAEIPDESGQSPTTICITLAPPQLPPRNGSFSIDQTTRKQTRETSL